MKRTDNLARILVVAGVIALGGCAPEIGSLEWCEQMDAKEKGDWTINDAAEYAKSCVLRKTSD
ncbi:MAG: DUF3012 domain-containing protein [Pseudomonadales bacterium]|nr:DUF3012 domain-containing protein [Pseudomonadales bacterium]